MYFSQDVEVASTTTDSGVSAVPAADGGNEESQAPKTKAPVRFGWVIGVMVSESTDRFIHVFISTVSTLHM